MQLLIDPKQQSNANWRVSDAKSSSAIAGVLILREQYAVGTEQVKIVL